MPPKIPDDIGLQPVLATREEEELRSTMLFSSRSQARVKNP
jgi:hypothetical protein